MMNWIALKRVNERVCGFVPSFFAPGTVSNRFSAYAHTITEYSPGFPHYGREIIFSPPLPTERSSFFSFCSLRQQFTKIRLFDYFFFSFLMAFDVLRFLSYNSFFYYSIWFTCILFLMVFWLRHLYFSPTVGYNLFSSSLDILYSIEFCYIFWNSFYTEFYFLFNILFFILFCSVFYYIT